MKLLHILVSLLVVLLHSCPGSSFVTHHRQSTSGTSSALFQSNNNDDELVRIQMQSAERKVQRLNRLLTTLERRSTQDRMEWMQERMAMTHKISVLKELLKDTTTPVQAAVEEQEVLVEYPVALVEEPSVTEETVTALELELTMAQEHEEELLLEQDRLEREVVILQEQIIQLRNVLKSEQYRSAELEDQLDQVLEEQESERMQYQVQLEAQTREIEAMRAKLEFYEHQQQQQPKIVRSVKNETMAMT